MKEFLWHNVFLSRVLNWFIAPIAYLFKKQAQEKKKFLWWFLSDDNMYGDLNWRPRLTNKVLRAIIWMYRNPLQNYYWKDYVEGTERYFEGTAVVKYGNDALSWRTMICTDTGDWHGKVLDPFSTRWGQQDITFERIDNEGNIQHCYRKSTCVPHRLGPWIIIEKRRSGHEGGLMQYNFTFPLFRYSDNKEFWEIWKSLPWKEINL